MKCSQFPAIFFLLSIFSTAFANQNQYEEIEAKNLQVSSKIAGLVSLIDKVEANDSNGKITGCIVPDTARYEYMISTHDFLEVQKIKYALAYFGKSIEKWKDRYADKHKETKVFLDKNSINNSNVCQFRDSDLGVKAHSNFVAIPKLEPLIAIYSHMWAQTRPLVDFGIGPEYVKYFPYPQVAPNCRSSEKNLKEIANKLAEIGNDLSEFKKLVSESMEEIGFVESLDDESMTCQKKEWAEQAYLKRLEENRRGSYEGVIETLKAESAE